MDTVKQDKSKRRKRDAMATTAHSNDASSQPARPPPISSFSTTHKPQKPSAIAKAGKGRFYTVSIALPGSILLNAQSPELRTHLAGQIARTCAIFSVDEIVVFHEPNHVAVDTTRATYQRGKYRQTTSETGSGDENDMDELLCRILQYLETPQYLRKALIPMHPSLRLAGLLPPLDMPHHLRKTDDALFREGVVVEPPADWRPSFGQSDTYSFVDVGLEHSVQVPSTLPLTSRVTVRLKPQPSIVADNAPKAENGFGWGYKVRKAGSVSKVLLECPYEGGYDLGIGTSERGTDVSVMAAEMPEFRHMLLVFGGLAGLEVTIEADGALGLSAEEAGDAFDHWINVCPNQGSRTIRTEEALMIALSRLKPAIEGNGARV